MTLASAVCLACFDPFQPAAPGVRVVNPAAHAAAQQKDLQLQQLTATGGQLPPLFCVPILVKVQSQQSCTPMAENE